VFQRRPGDLVGSQNDRAADVQRWRSARLEKATSKIMDTP
jgi:hypothetical protein